MRILIDGHNLALPRGSGIASYGRRLLADLAALGHRTGVLFDLSSSPDPTLADIRFFDAPRVRKGRLQRLAQRAGWVADIYGLNALRRPAAQAIGGSGLVLRQASRLDIANAHDILTVPDLFGRAHRRFQTRRRLFEIDVPDGVDVVHWTSFLPVRARNAANIVTVHDVVPLRLPYTTLDDKRMYRDLLQALAATADGFFAVSQSARADFLQATGIDGARVVTTWQSLGSDLAAPAASEAVQAAVLRRFGLEPGRFLLWSGVIEPKKNVGRLLQAFLYSDVALPLVLVGRKGWLWKKELELLDGARSAGDRVLLLGYQPREVLECLVRSARALAFPSLYEGFGLPVLEAMSAGTPVLTSDAGALGEVAGDAALLVDPLSVDSIREGLRRIATDDALVARLRQAGPVQAGKFAPGIVRARIAAGYRQFTAGAAPAALAPAVAARPQARV